MKSRHHAQITAVAVALLFAMLGPVALAAAAPKPPAPYVPAPVIRLGGANRYDVAVTAAFTAFPGWAGLTDIVIASGDDRAAADPLTSAGLAGVYNGAVLLVSPTLTKGRLPLATENALAGIRAANGGKVNIHVVGGTKSIPATVYKRLSALRGTGTIERLAAADRYELSVLIARRVNSVVGAGGVSGVMLAAGDNSAAFYDTLAASPIAYKKHKPLLLARKGGLPSGVASALNSTFATATVVAVSSPTYLPAGVTGAARATERMATTAERTAAATQIADYAIAHNWLKASSTAVANRLPDALTGGSALGSMGGVLLYTNASPLAPATSAWLTTNKTSIDHAYVLGGSVSVADGTLAQIVNALK